MSNRTTYLLLRISVAACFIGHGAFGIIGKEAWLPYFAVTGIPASAAWLLMPVVGTVDIAIGVLALARPMWAVFAWAAAWTLWTAALRPLAGESLWELLERAGNYGVPIAILVWAGRPRSLRDAFQRLPAPPLTDARLQRLRSVLVVTAALLLIGHGGFGLFERKELLATHYAAVGLGASLVPLIGGLEIALACVLLARPTVPLLFGVMAWKIASEALYPLAGAPFWEFVERGGSYFAPLVAALLAAAAPTIARSARVRVAATAPILGLALLLMAAPLVAARATPSAPAGSLQQTVPLERLRAGDAVLLCRHALTDRSQPDARPVDPTDRATQRNLSRAGISQARSLGQELRRLDVPIGEVLASPYFRTMESAELAFGRVESEPALAFNGSDDAFRALLQRPVAGGNRVLMSHAGRIFRVVAERTIGGLGEGDCAVIDPQRDRYRVLGRVRAHDWQVLDREST